jgi:hypothetical protein
MRAALFASLVAVLGAEEAAAQTQSRCRVMDPTGTPLNVRSAPNGPIVATLQNGALVSLVSGEKDDRGRVWAFISDKATGQPWGWVFREFIACF